jgi:hypothetical protein
MVWLKKIIELIVSPFSIWKQKRERKKRIEELKKRDPFIYK